MKKRLCSLLIALVILLASQLTIVSAGGTIGELSSESFFTDFDNMEAGTNYTDEDIQNATGIPMDFKTYSATGTPVSASIIEESDGNKFIRLNAIAQGDTIDSLYTLSSPFEVGKLEAGFEFGPAGTGKGQWHFFMIYGQNNTNTSTISWSNVIAKTSSSNIGTVLVQSPTRNAKGRLTLRVEVSRTSNTDDWDVKVYNDALDPAVLVYDGIIPASFGNIHSIKPIRYYGGTGGWSADFDNYFVKKTSYAQVTNGIETNSLGSDVEKFSLTFNEQLKNPDDKITLVNMTNENAEPITTKTSYIAEAKKLEVMPDSFLDYDTTYKVVFEKGGVASYQFTTKSAPISITPGSVTYSNESGTLTEIPASGTFNASYTATAAASVPDKHLVVLLIAYNSQKVAVAFDVQSQPLTPPSVSNVTATLNNLKGGEVTEVKAFIWEYKDGIGFRPIK